MGRALSRMHEIGRCSQCQIDARALMRVQVLTLRSRFYLRRNFSLFEKGRMGRADIQK